MNRILNSQLGSRKIHTGALCHADRFSGCSFLIGERHLNEDSRHPLNKQSSGFEGQTGPEHRLAWHLASELRLHVVGSLGAPGAEGCSRSNEKFRLVH